MNLDPTNTHRPTSDAALNAVLAELVTGIRAILGANFIAAYLQGSFAVGDWDADSDVDFLVAIDQAVSDADLVALQAMHRRIYALASPWAQHLEGSYFPQALLRRAGPAREKLLYLDNGSRELIWSDHDNELVVRWVVREHGITLAGPAPATLIDPVAADDLRREIARTMHEWGGDISAGRYSPANRWAQPFVVLSYCRMLHSLRTGRVESKLAGAQWAQTTLDSRWAGLIQRALAERPNPSLKYHQPADPEDLKATLDFVGYALAVAHDRGVA